MTESLQHGGPLPPAMEKAQTGEPSKRRGSDGGGAHRTGPGMDLRGADGAVPSSERRAVRVFLQALEDLCEGLKGVRLER